MRNGKKNLKYDMEQQNIRISELTGRMCKMLELLLNTREEETISS